MKKITILLFLSVIFSSCILNKKIEIVPEPISETKEENIEIKKGYLVDKSKKKEILFLILGNKKIKIYQLIKKNGLESIKNIKIDGDLLIFTIYGGVPSSSFNDIFSYYSINKQILRHVSGKFSKNKKYIYTCRVLGNEFREIIIHDMEDNKDTKYELEGKYVSFCKYDKKNNILKYELSGINGKTKYEYNFYSGKIKNIIK